MLLSIIVPIYNVEKYINECVDSLLAQDISKDEYEIILVDDGSPDNCPKICDDYAEKNSNVKVVHKQNGGVSSARNAGLDNATGKYVWFVDGDDFIGANILGKIKAELLKGDFDECRLYMYEFKDGTDITYFSNIPAEKHTAKYDNFYTARLFKREIIEKLNLRFNTGMTYQEDNVFHTMLCPYLKTKTAMLDCISYYYRQRSGSLKSSDGKNIADSFIIGAKVMKDLYDNPPVEYNGYAFVLYMFTARVMQYIAALKGEDRRKYLKNVKEKGLFPLKYSKEYTHWTNKSNMSFKKKIFEFLKATAYTRFSFFALTVLSKIK